jgi:hypothetical protein
MDAVKEGDGNRLLRCFMIVLLFDYKCKHTKYPYGLLLFFVTKDACLLVHNRFVNKKGRMAGNVPLDLHMEHLKLDMKRLLQTMGGKITCATAQRCARSKTVMNKVIDSVHEECNKSHYSYHGEKNSVQTVKSIIHDLLQGKVFEHIPERSY